MKYAIPAANQQVGGVHIYLHTGCLRDLPETSSVPTVLRDVDWDSAPSEEVFHAIKSAGFTGLQPKNGSVPAARAAGLAVYPG